LPGGGDATAVSLTGLLRVRQLIETDARLCRWRVSARPHRDRRRYKDWFTRGENVRNFITYGDFAGPPRTTASACRAASCWTAICRRFIPSI
jgi:hypothetical protein